MDSVSDAVADPSSSVDNCGASAGTGWGFPDESMVSASTNPDLGASPQDTPSTVAVTPMFGRSGQKHQQRGGVKTNLVVGPAFAETVPLTNPPKAVGRGRGMTLPAWMTAGSAALQGGLQQQAPLEHKSSAQAPRSTGLYSFRPRPSSPSRQPVNPNDGDKTTHVKKDAIKNKSKSEYKQAAEMGAFLVGADATGSDPSGVSAGGQGKGIHANSETSRGQEPAPSPAPIAGVSAESPATSPSANSLPAGGRGRGRTLPAWMTANAETMRGGLQQQATLECIPVPRVPRPTGFDSSCPQPSSQGVATSSGNNDSTRKTKNNACESSQVPLAARKGAFHVGVGVRGSALSQGPATGGRKSGRRQKRFETLRGEYSAPVHTADWSVSAPALHQQTSTMRAGRGRGMTLPAWMDVPPGGLQRQELLASGSVQKVTRPTGLYSSRPHQGSPSASPNTLNTGTQKGTINTKAEKMEPQSAGISADQSGIPATTRPELNSWHDKVDTVAWQNPSHAATVASHREPGEGMVIAGPAVRCQETSCELSGSKRVRDEELAVAPTIVSNTEADTPGQQARIVVMMDVIDRMASLGLQRPAKKRKGTPSKISPAKNLVTTRAGFSILHHHANPNQRQLNVRGNASPAMNIFGEERSVDKSNESSAPQPRFKIVHHHASRNQRQLNVRGNASPAMDISGEERSVDKSNESSAPRPRFKILHHHASPDQRQLNVRGNASPAMDISGEELTVNKSKQSSGPPPAHPPFTARPLPPANPKMVCPSLVVIDGRDLGRVYSETNGGWSARGPLLAIQFFKRHGVECVALLRRELMAGVTTQDEFYSALQEARSTRSISEIPPNAKANTFILKHAIDRNAHVVTNKHLGGLVGCKESLELLAQTEQDLRAYLCRNIVSYTFTRDEFVPNPQAPLIRTLKHVAP